MVQWEVVKRTMHQRVFHHFPDGGAGRAEARVNGLLGTRRVPRRVLHPAIFPRRLAWKAVPSLLPQHPEWWLRFPRGLWVQAPAICFLPSFFFFLTMMASHALVCTSLVVVLLLVVIDRKGADRVHFRGGGPPSRGFLCLGGQDQFIQNGA